MSDLAGLLQRIEAAEGPDVTLMYVVCALALCAAVVKAKMEEALFDEAAKGAIDFTTGEPA